MDNRIGKVIFLATGAIQALRFTRSGILRMVAKEQEHKGNRPRMSGVLWDTFTGSAPYRDIFMRTLSPLFLGSLLYQLARGFSFQQKGIQTREDTVALVDLGKIYRPGEDIIRQGEQGECMYVIQAGRVEVIREREGAELKLAEMGEGDFFGEMALFERDVRSATVRPLGEVRVLTVDKKMFLRKIHEGPSLAFRVMQKLSQRVRELNQELAKATAASAVPR